MLANEIQHRLRSYQHAADLFQSEQADLRLVNAFYDCLKHDRWLVALMGNGAYMYHQNGQANQKGTVTAPQYAIDPLVALSEIPANLCAPLKFTVSQDEETFTATAAIGDGEYFARSRGMTYAEAASRALMALLCLYIAYPPETEMEEPSHAQTN